ncbi:hypothetical protein [Nocardioides litoris]|uniref:hypothetical protein n=1 Tax=Nocardioides litoris TaxID=1926648 RepID=UPI00111FC8F9|nr:hypothetical protein [Nocardioides litoris]
MQQVTLHEQRPERSSRDHGFRHGVRVASLVGVGASVVAVVAAETGSRRLFLLATVVPPAVLVLVTAAQADQRRRYGAGLLVGTASGAVVCLLALLVWAVSEGALAG